MCAMCVDAIVRLLYAEWGKDIRTIGLRNGITTGEQSARLDEDSSLIYSPMLPRKTAHIQKQHARRNVDDLHANGR